MKLILPLRLISLVGHLVVSILLLSNRDFNVRVCIPWDYDSDQYNSKDTELIIGFSLSIALLVLESVGFLSGISMLHTKQSLFSLLAHWSGSLALLCFMLDGWECGLFWWMFVLTNVMPALSELYVVVGLTLLGYHDVHTANKQLQLAKS